MYEKDRDINIEISMNEPLISVIVPIYNVKSYVRECLDSLAMQTMKDIEVICIDDGSIDESGSIAEEFLSDSRFRVIHTINRGLSAARNRGIEAANSSMLMFVDSDDMVDKDFCRMPYEAMIKNNADLVIFGYSDIVNGRCKKRKLKHVGTVNYETAIDWGGTVAWNKLYRKELFKRVKYPEGHVYEDIATTHNLIYAATSIVCLDENLYYHRYRKDSICHTVSNEMDRLLMSKKRYEDLMKHGYPEKKAQARLYGAALRCCGRAEIIQSRPYDEATEILMNIRGMPEGLTKKEFYMFFCWRMNKRLYRLLYKVILNQLNKDVMGE